MNAGPGRLRKRAACACSRLFRLIMLKMSWIFAFRSLRLDGWDQRPRLPAPVYCRGSPAGLTKFAFPRNAFVQFTGMFDVIFKFTVSFG